MYIYIYIYIYTYIYIRNIMPRDICIYICPYTYTNDIPTYIHIYIYKSAHMHSGWVHTDVPNTYIHISLDMMFPIYIYVYIYIYIYMYKYIFILVIHIHICIHIYIYRCTHAFRLGTSLSGEARLEVCKGNRLVCPLITPGVLVPFFFVHMLA